MANSVDPDQTAPIYIGAVCSMSMLFASIQGQDPCCFKKNHFHLLVLFTAISDLKFLLTLSFSSCQYQSYYPLD